MTQKSILNLMKIMTSIPMSMIPIWTQRKQTGRPIPKEQADIRYEKIVKDAQDELDEKKEELEEKRAEAEAELESAKQQLTDGETEISDGKNQIASAK